MFTVFDIETTGLSTTSDDIIQFSYIRFDDNNMPVQAETLYYYYEGMHWSEEAEAVHHISLDTVKAHAEEFEANVIKMYSVLSLANVVGFNSNDFDNVFVRNWLSRMGMSNMQLGIQKDIMLLARPVVHKARISLVKLCDKLGLTPDIIRNFEKLCYKNEGTQSHNASYDVAATALCALKFMREGYLTWKFGKTDVVASGDMFGNDFGDESEINLPEDPNGFWVDCGSKYVWIVTDSNKFATREISTEKPDGVILRPKGIEGIAVYEYKYVFDWCSLEYDKDSKLVIHFDYGDFFASNMPFDKLLSQLKEESDRRCLEK